MHVRSLFWMTLAAIFLVLSEPATARLESSRTEFSEPAETSVHLVLAFSRRVNPKRSNVEIRDSRGASVQIGDLRTSEGGIELEIPLSSPLRPDVYTIRWRAVSMNGIVDVGGYQFTIDPIPVGIPGIARQ